MLCGAVFCWEGVPLLPFFLWSISCLGKTFSFAGDMHASFLNPQAVSWSCQANVYFTVYIMCVVSTLLGLNQDLFFLCNCWELYLEKADLVARWPAQPDG